MGRKKYGGCACLRWQKKFRDLNASRKHEPPKPRQSSVNTKRPAEPRKTRRFLDLVGRKLYDGCVFYRAESFVVQGGLRTASGEVSVRAEHSGARGSPKRPRVAFLLGLEGVRNRTPKDRN